MAGRKSKTGNGRPYKAKRSQKPKLIDLSDPETGSFWNDKLAAERAEPSPSTWDWEGLTDLTTNDATNMDSWTGPDVFPETHGWGNQGMFNTKDLAIIQGWKFGGTAMVPAQPVQNYSLLDVQVPMDAPFPIDAPLAIGAPLSIDTVAVDAPLSIDTPLAAAEDPDHWDLYAPVVVKTKEELRMERAMEACEGWPWTGVPKKLITLCPYHINQDPIEGVLSLPRVNQSSAFFRRLMNVEDIALLVLKLVFRHHDSAWKLAATCQQMWEISSNNLDIWDTTTGFFNGCDKAIFKDSSVSRNASVSAQVVVTPLRRREGPATYLEEARSIRGICLSINNFKDSLRNIQFHRVAFLNINVLALLIPQMSNLEDLGIYKCQLMHLGTTLKLLELLTVDRKQEQSVYLDFYPNYHLGPKEGGTYSTGAYGVSWDDLGFDTCLGIWSLTKRIVRQARQQGIDFESPHTMFRQWLEKTPCWMVGPTLTALFDPSKSALQVAAMVQYRFFHGSVTKMQASYGYTCDRKWWGRAIYCIECGTTQMGVFFRKLLGADQLNVPEGQHEQCYGCALTFALRREDDHYKTPQRTIVRDWLMDKYHDAALGKDVGIWNTTNPWKAIDDFELKHVEDMAQKLDERRARETIQHGYDHKTQDRQFPFTRRELSGKRGPYTKSPDVHQWKNEEKAYIKGGEMWKYYAQDHDKYDQHGRYY